MKDAVQNAIKLSQLQLLVAVAEAQSFSGASLRLGISQSAVSHGIATLEESLGIVLFARGRHGARLTPVGDRILSHAQRLLEQRDAILKEAALAKGLSVGQVRVATFRSVATHVLPQVMGDFSRRFPGIALNLAEHDSGVALEQALREGRADIGITILPVGPQLTAWPLVEDEFIVLLPPQTQLRGQPLSWAALLAQPLIMPPLDDPMMRPLYEHLDGQALGQPLRVVNQVETDATIVCLVAQGLGATILPRLAASPIPAAVQVYSLPTPLLRQVGIAVATEALQPPPVYALLEMLQAIAAPA